VDTRWDVHEHKRECGGYWEVANGRTGGNRRVGGELAEKEPKQCFGATAWRGMARHGRTAYAALAKHGITTMLNMISACFLEINHSLK